MSLTLNGRSGLRYVFEGPYKNVENISDRAGVYAIICEKDNKHFLIDVGEAAKVKERISTHDRKDCWSTNCFGIIEYAVYYIEYGKKPSRVDIEQDIRDNYNIPCGVR